MADIRCPMCGRENPADLAVCRYCQARLKPLIYSPPLGDEPDNSIQNFNKPDLPYRKGQIEDEAGTKPLASRVEEDAGQVAELPGEVESAAEDWLSGLEEESTREEKKLVKDSPQAGEESTGKWEQVERWIFDEDVIDKDLNDFTGRRAPSVTDWLASLDDPTGLAVDGEGASTWNPGSGETASEDSDELPDWLKNLAEDEVAPEDSGLPGWLFESKPVPEIPEPEEGLDRVAAVETDVGELEKSVSPGPERGSALDTGPLGPAAGVEESGESGEESPDQIDNLSFLDLPGEENANLVSEEDGAGVEVDFAEGALEEGSFEDESHEEDAFEEISFDGDLPDWLQQVEPPEEEPQIEEPQLEGTPVDAEPDLAPADIPGWLASMRPLDGEAPEEPAGEDEPENPELAGPLFGLHDLLQVELPSTDRQINTGLSVRVQATASQRNHADLLVSMLEGSWEASPDRPRAVSSVQHLRWAIALVIFLAVLWSMVTGARLSPEPVPGEGPLSVDRIITDLPANARVLVAFDYQPGRAGEMEAAAEAVIDHLVQTGAYLVMVSTNTSGPALAERFMHNLAPAGQNAGGEAYVNLGFIPGGPVGLLGFAQNPRWSLPYTIDGMPAWGSGSRPGLPPLQGIQQLRDFDLLLVIVDDPSIGRYWIEQVRPQLAGEDYQTPMVMISSAQAEPLLLPYYLSSPRQLEGLMAGLRDGSGYAQLTGQPGRSGIYWDAFSSGLFVAVVIIFAGSILYYLLSGTRGSEHAEGIL